MTTQFATADWLVFTVYVLVMISTGWYFNRQKSANTDEYFLGGHKMPVFLVAVSVLATSQSAATFLGGPDQGYRNDLSYLATNMGAFIAAFFVAFFLIPKFYQHKVTTVYELLSQRFGKRAQKQAGMMYLFGRVFASGARLYMAAIAVSMILFGNISAENVIISTLVLTTVGLLYSIIGGIRTVIYSDAIQCCVYVSAAILVLYFLLQAIPADFSQILDALQNPPDREQSKLTVFNFNLDFTSSGVFTVWSALTGFVLLNIAAFGLDQDMTQRVLTCKDARQGSLAMIYSVIMVIPVMFLFIAIGLLLYLLYQRPDLAMGETAQTINQTFSGEKITIFMYYVLNEIPAGVKGLVTIGVIAAALSTLNSGLNSMASVLVQDMYRPYLEKRQINKPAQHFVKAGQVGMALVAMALSSMAVLCYYWQQYSDMPLLAFALSVMVFSYSGLLGVYFTAVFTNRGSATTVPMALITGFLVSLVFQPYVIDNILPDQWQFNLGFTWQLCIGALLSFLVCFAGNNNHDPLKVKQMEVQP
ncbi:sodium:solute symporter [Thalassotalea mangrovi]|uniref:Sodium:solute symporter n=1 Tax=Thalassotalea mangrovi TaxID=2572245 RepID=A0A4U1BAB5_9GAMM|nr:sodium:solute symporter [Thalassotalea mangrovi]TKB47463.1 sodium:solute symporter [Thalassotalea mangrovi]